MPLPTKPTVLRPGRLATPQKDNYSASTVKLVFGQETVTITVEKAREYRRQLQEAIEWLELHDLSVRLTSNDAAPPTGVTMLLPGGYRNVLASVVIMRGINFLVKCSGVDEGSITSMLYGRPIEAAIVEKMMRFTRERIGDGSAERGRTQKPVSPL